MRELTATLEACRHATPTAPLGTENSLARKVQQYVAANPISFEPEFQLKPQGEAPMERVKLAPREALPWISVDQAADRPIVMKLIKIHDLAGRMSAVLADGTPFEGTFGDADHLSLKLGALVGHWITVTGQLELDQKPLSTSQRLSGSISRILAVSTSWHEARLPAIHKALDAISSLPKIHPPAFDPNAGPLFAALGDNTPV